MNYTLWEVNVQFNLYGSGLRLLRIHHAGL
jgi:hypothetical protein